MKYWFKNVADNIYIYPKSAPRNLILQTRTSDCNSALGDLVYCLERILCLYMDLYIRVAYLIDWIHNRKYQEIR